MDKYHLDKERRNLESSRSKQQKRVDGWYDLLAKEKDAHKQVLLENKINKAEKQLHDKNIKIKTIKNLL